jgi:ribosomal protein S21
MVRVVTAGNLPVARERRIPLEKPALRQPSRRMIVGVKVHVGEGEPIEHALRRLRNLIRRCNRWPVYLPPGGKRRQEYYQKPSVLRRQKRFFNGIMRRMSGR